MIKSFQLKCNTLKSEYFEHKRRSDSARHYKNFEMNNPGDYVSTHCFDYYKCIFIHIPKTAGISISKTLFGNLSGSHWGITHYTGVFGKRTIDEYFKFAFVRNPWDRLYSAYNFLKNGGITENDTRFTKENLSGVNSFEEFILEWLNEGSLIVYWHFVPQHYFITSKKNRDKILVDFVGKFENIEEDFQKVCRQLKLQNKHLLHINDNGRPGGSYRNAYTQKMIDKVADLYKKDIDLFNYSFGE
jgi:hypothetical protein